MDVAPLPTVPRAPRPGSALRVIRLAGRTDPARLAAGVALLQDAGLVVQFDPDFEDPPLFAPYLAASDRARLQNWEAALASPDADVLIAARGGYGVTRILDQIDMARLRSTQKLVVGYSDLTALHLAAAAAGYATVHGPMVAGLDRYTPEDGSFAALVDLCTGRLPATPQPTVWWETSSRSWRPLTQATFSPVKGRLLGGNLTLMAALLGTPTLRHFDDCIVLIEEIGEAAYRLDRLLTQLRADGRLARARAIVVGQLTDCAKELGDDGPLALIAERLGDLGVPLVAGLPVGHEAPNLPLWHGLSYQLAPAGLALTDSAQTALRDAGWRPPRANNQPAAASPFPHKGGADDVDALLARALVTGEVGSGLQVAVLHRGALVYETAMGTTGSAQDTLNLPVSARTAFDLASLTKALSTAALAARAIDRGLMSPDDVVPSDLCAEPTTLAALLAHTAGLPAHVPVYQDARRAADPLATALQTFATIPADRVGYTYSDVGYIALGRWLARVYETSLDQALANEVLAPLGLVGRLYFAPLGAADPHHQGPVVATEFCPWRGTTLQGVVHDENAQVLGGIAGHAGLFGDAAAVVTLTRALLVARAPSVLLSRPTQAWMLSRPLHAGSHTHGWDTPSGPASSAGTRLSRNHTFGHLGFTGTSVWYDQQADLCVCLLANRVHPSRDAVAGIRRLRPAVCDLVVRVWGG